VALDGPVHPDVARAWPPPPLASSRVRLRGPRAQDRPAFVELYASPPVRAHLGGALTRVEAERSFPSAPEARPGLLVAEREGSMVGLVLLDGRDPARPRPPSVAAGTVEISYQLLPDAWGQGLAQEACTLALDWLGDVAPRTTVLLVTRTTNDASLRLAHRLGFTESGGVEEFGHPQWCGTRPAHRGRRPDGTDPGRAGPADA
jgi:RimJ/RimL family protein N-acetyltransferase